MNAKNTMKDELSTDIERLVWHEKELQRVIDRVEEQQTIMEQLRMYKADIEKKKDDLILKLHNHGIVFQRHEQIFSQKEPEVAPETDSNKQLTDTLSKTELRTLIQSVLKETLMETTQPITKEPQSTQPKENVLLDLTDNDDARSEISSTAYIFDTPKSGRRNIPVISPTSLPVNVKR